MRLGEKARLFFKTTVGDERAGRCALDPVLGDLMKRDGPR